VQPLLLQIGHFFFSFHLREPSLLTDGSDDTDDEVPDELDITLELPSLSSLSDKLSEVSPRMGAESIAEDDCAGK